MCCKFPGQHDEFCLKRYPNSTLCEACGDRKQDGDDVNAANILATALFVLGMPKCGTTSLHAGHQVRLQPVLNDEQQLVAVTPVSESLEPTQSGRRRRRSTREQRLADNRSARLTREQRLELKKEQR